MKISGYQDFMCRNHTFSSRNILHPTKNFHKWQYQIQYETYCNFILPDHPDSGQIFRVSSLQAYYTYYAPAGKRLRVGNLTPN